MDWEKVYRTTGGGLVPRINSRIIILSPYSSQEHAIIGTVLYTVVCQVDNKQVCQELLAFLPFDFRPLQSPILVCSLVLCLTTMADGWLVHGKEQQSSLSPPFPKHYYQTTSSAAPIPEQFIKPQQQHAHRAAGGTGLRD